MLMQGLFLFAYNADIRYNYIMTVEEDYKGIFNRYEFAEVEKMILDILEKNPQGMTEKEIKNAMPQEPSNINVSNTLIFMDKYIYRNFQKRPKYFLKPKKNENELLLELYINILKENNDFKEIEIDESDKIRFSYQFRYVYWLCINENNIKTAELSYNRFLNFNNDDDEVEALYLLNEINRKYIIAKLYYDEETKEITAKADLYVTGIQSTNDGFVFNNKEQFIEQLLEAHTAIQSATEDFFEEFKEIEQD